MLKLKFQYFGTWCEELTLLKRPWSWERLQVGGEQDNRGWDGWMASPTCWAWFWVKLRELVMDMEAWPAAVYVVAKSRTWLSNWTELNWIERGGSNYTWEAFCNSVVITHFIFFMVFTPSQRVMYSFIHSSIHPSILFVFIVIQDGAWEYQCF